jgi:hypothetical protein
MKKKKWRKPEMIVLVRSKPEEAVLDSCKTSTEEVTGNSWSATGCGNYPGHFCGDCQVQVVS